MSVQKYVVSREESGFTLLKNTAVQGLTDIEALGLWAYLYSLPKNWFFYKDQIKNHFKIGRERLNRLLKVLQDCNLIRMENLRDKKGRFLHVNIVVYNGSEFAQKNDQNITKDVCNGDDDAQNAQDQKTNINNSLSECAHPSTENPSTASQLLATDTYKDIYKNNINNKEDINNISNSASDDAHADLENSFDRFWKVYPVKKNKMRARMLWERKGLYRKADEVIADVEARLLQDTAWQNRQFIPHPSTYLLNERWNDEITYSTPKASGSGKSSSFDAYMNGTNGGNTYDQHGNTYDPFR